jgi:hypothetical protein
VSDEYLEIADRVDEPLLLVNGARVTMRDGEIIAPGQGLPNTGTVTMEIGTSPTQP